MADMVGNLRVVDRPLAGELFRVMEQLAAATYWDTDSVGAILEQLRSALFTEVSVGEVVRVIDTLVDVLVGERDVQDVWRRNRKTVETAASVETSPRIGAVLVLQRSGLAA